MQVTKVTAGFQNQTAERKLFTDEELQREFDYYMAQKLLEKLREKNAHELQGRIGQNHGEKPPIFLSLSGSDYALNDLLFAGVRANMSVPKER